MAQGVNRATRVRLQAAALCVVVVGGSWLVSALALGVGGAVGAMVAGIVVLAFFGSGYLLQRVFLAMTDLRGLVATLVGYLVRIAAVWLVASRLSGVLGGQEIRWGVVVGSVAAVIGWITALCLAQVNARVPIYDQGRGAHQGWVA